MSKSLIIFEYSPHDLEKQLPQEFQDLKQEIFDDLKKSNLLEQNFVRIDNIIVHIEQNKHLGDHTYLTKVSLVSPTHGADFNHSVESKDYLQTIRSSVHDLIKFVLAKKDKLETQDKDSNQTNF
ncbi:MAG: hypothetical protein ACKO96_26995 [Flammeovirgaceae bacterium]